MIVVFKKTVTLFQSLVKQCYFSKNILIRIILLVALEGQTTILEN